MQTAAAGCSPFRERVKPLWPAAFSTRQHPHGANNAAASIRDPRASQLVPRKICTTVNNRAPIIGRGASITREGIIDWPRRNLIPRHTMRHDRRRAAFLSAWDLGRTLNSACVRDIYDYRVIACVPRPRPKEHLKRGPGHDYRVSKIIMLRLACITGIKWREV